MKILLDTCTFIWIVEGSASLSTRARETFEDAGNEVYLSAVSSWELALKYQIGKLALPLAPESFVPRERERHGIDHLPLAEEAASRVHLLPPLHRDPFDRMLVTQAIVSGLTILTPDEAIRGYPVHAMW